MTLSGPTILSQSGPGSSGNEGVHHILQSSSITEASPSDPEHSLQSVYSTASTDWALDQYASGGH